MADQTRTVLLKIDLENSEAVKAAAQTRIEIQKLKDEKSLLDQQLKDISGIDKSSKAYTDLQEKIVKNSAETKAYQNQLRFLDKEIENNIKINNTAAGSNDQLKATINLLTQQYDKLSSEQLANEEIGGKLGANILKLTEELKANKDAIGENRLNVGNYKKSLEEVIQSLNLQNVTIEKSNQELQQQKKSIQDIFKPTKDQSDQLNKINAQLEQNNQQYKSNSDLIQQTATSIGFLANKEKETEQETINLGNTIGGLRQKMADLKKLIDDPDLTLEEYEKLNEQLRKVQFEIDRASGKIDEFGRTEPKNPVKKSMDDTAEAVGALSQSIGLLTIAFGNNENAQKFQEKALKAIAVTTTIANIAKSRGAILDTIQLAKIKALTIAQNIYTKAIGRSTGAARLFRVALAATGIGAVVLLLGELIFNFDSVSKHVNRAINSIRTFTDRVSNGNKFVKALVETLLLVASPLVTIIRLISDFNGTITQFQNAINNAYDSLINFTDGIPILGSVLKNAKSQFNFVANAIKSLDGSTKKFNPSVEDLTKRYEEFNYQLDQNIKNIQRQIRVTTAQGNSENKVAALTKKLLNETTKEREKAFNRAVLISNKLIQQNGKLNDEQQKLFDKVQNDFRDAQIEEAAFQAEQNQKARERAQERLQIERDLTAELNALRNSLIKDDFERQRAELEEQFRIDKEANDIAIKENIKRFGEQSKIVSDLRAKDLLLKEKFNQESFEIDKEQANKEVDALIEKIDDEEQAIRESFVFRSQQLKDALDFEIKLQGATFVSIAKNEREKTQEQIDQQIVRLQLSQKYFEDQLSLAKEFALEDGRFSDEELSNLNLISQSITDIGEKIKELQKTKNILGFTQEELDNLKSGVDSFLQGMQAIIDIINASFESRKRLVDDTIDAEIEAVENSTQSQVAKDKKIEQLEKKRAIQQHKIQVEQFEFQQATATIQAIIQGALAFITALTSGVPPFNFINAGLVALSTGAQIGIINSQKPPTKPKFQEGGFTEMSGNPYLVSKKSNKYRDVHHNEYITPWKVLRRPEAWPAVNYLESLRLDIPGSLGLSGFADGGLNARTLNTPQFDEQSIAATVAREVALSLANVTIITEVTEFERVRSGMIKNRAVATA